MLSEVFEISHIANFNFFSIQLFTWTQFPDIISSKEYLHPKLDNTDLKLWLS